MVEKRKLILRNYQSPGDIVMLTAAVRDIHQCCPDEFLTDVRTPCPHLWENNPYLTHINDEDPDAEVIECQYPLVHSSNQQPWHFLHGFTQFLSTALNRNIYPTRFSGDIHVSDLEKSWYSQVKEIVGADIPFWIIVAGGKMDFTIKWWSPERFQAVVDHFGEEALFVQVGELDEHYHPPLRNVIDLRGKTDLRQLIRLVHHSSGVICPVTLLMHLAAAVESPPHSNQSRPCVVVAGGREPPHWESYPHHQFLHTVGSLACCDNGGCWKSRTKPLGDGDRKDSPENLCVDVVDDLPRCMDMITTDRVIDSILKYYEGGAMRYLTAEEKMVAKPHRT